jgi:hypothetical protein
VLLQADGTDDGLFDAVAVRVLGRGTQGEVLRLGRGAQRGRPAVPRPFEALLVPGGAVVIGDGEPAVRILPD